MHSCLYFSRLGRPYLLRAVYTPGQAPCNLSTPRYIHTRTTSNVRSLKHSLSLKWFGQGVSRHESTLSHGARGVNVLDTTSRNNDTPTSISATVEEKRLDIRRVVGRSVSIGTQWPAGIPTKKLKGISPATRLAEYLDLTDKEEKATYWYLMKNDASHRSLPIIVMHYLHTSSVSENLWDSLDRTYRKAALEYLHSRDYTLDDVAHWAWVLSGESPDHQIDRFLSAYPHRPTFILTEVLRKDIQQVESLKRILLYAWSQLLSTCLPIRHPTQNERFIFKLIPENAFTLLISRLLSQSRLIWPPAMVSITKMVPHYVEAFTTSKGQSADNLDDQLLERLCALNNYVLPLLALPASLEPLKSMAYNWTAQKVLLKLAGQCNPSLLLDRDSYRAVIQVQAASQKTEQEKRAATLRLRSWPPWRIEQDGMDASRNFDDDLSRVTTALMRAQEAGFREQAFAQRMKIYGGYELDGTPTIHTRVMTKWRPGDTNLYPWSLDPDLWAARVQATRDVREAWRAFVAFQDSGGQPSQPVFLAMFTKLEYEQRRQGKKAKPGAAPGDGKEVMPVPDDNISAFYRSQTQPPTLDALYQEMLESGLLPSGQCLNFLVRHARTPTKGLRYLRDGGIGAVALRYLSGGTNSGSTLRRPNAQHLVSLDKRTFGAYIQMICRFAPKAILATSENSSGVYILAPKASGKKSQEGKNDKKVSKKGLTGERPRDWVIEEVHKTMFPRLSNPLHHASQLLMLEKPVFRPAWYSLFEALARRNVIVSREIISGSKSDELAWLHLVHALQSFHECGLELDPFGFTLICNGFAKFAAAAAHSSEDHQKSIAEGTQLLKGLFADLSKGDDAPHWIPKLLHNVKTVHLHTYMRCMGIVGDHDEIISVLQWMVDNRLHLEENSSRDKNSIKLMQRTLVAARISCYGTEYEARAAALVRQVDTWQWPDDGDVEEYTRSSDHDEEGDEHEGDEEGDQEEEDDGQESRM